jgi:hypothetical protein
MIPRTQSPTHWLGLAAASLLLFTGGLLCAQSTPGTPSQNQPADKPAPGSAPEKAAPAKAPAVKTAVAEAQPTQKPGPATDRAQSYYHLALAATYEDDAISEGKPDDVTHAVEEYKSALNADPNSAELNNGLADLYFRTGRVREAEVTARGLLKTSRPTNCWAGFTCASSARARTASRRHRPPATPSTRPSRNSRRLSPSRQRA